MEQPKARAYCNKVARAIKILRRHTVGGEDAFVASVQEFGERTGVVTKKQLSVIGKLYWKHIPRTNWDAWWR